eukprot:8408079-Pyramimonas_sp.AAC.1
MSLVLRRFLFDLGKEGGGERIAEEVASMSVCRVARCSCDGDWAVRKTNCGGGEERCARCLINWPIVLRRCRYHWGEAAQR